MGLFDLFKKRPEHQYQNRKDVPAELINEAQKVEASPKYLKHIYKKYYSGYPEMPFISKDRELYDSTWEESLAFFPNRIIAKETMTRFNDGLLPGHVYMLYWIHMINRKQVPGYFEYEYGIQFDKEKKFLVAQGYLDQSGKLSKKGENAIKRHIRIIKEKSPNADLSFLDVAPEYITYDPNDRSFEKPVQIIDYDTPSHPMFKSREWKKREKENKEFQKYQIELRPVSDEYFYQFQLMEKNWSTLSKLKDYHGSQAQNFEMLCKDNIKVCRKMIAIEKKYKENPTENIPAFKRLAMLYEKQGDFEKAISVCVDAIRSGSWSGMQGRLDRMIKKAGREPSRYEEMLINKDFS